MISPLPAELCRQRSRWKPARRPVDVTASARASAGGASPPTFSKKATTSSRLQSAIVSASYATSVAKQSMAISSICALVSGMCYVPAQVQACGADGRASYSVRRLARVRCGPHTTPTSLNAACGSR
eukprot:21476-Prymnesium_polylepis.1